MTASFHLTLRDRHWFLLYWSLNDGPSLRSSGWDRCVCCHMNLPFRKRTL